VAQGRLTENVLAGKGTWYIKGTEEAMDMGLGLAVVIPLIDDQPRPPVYPDYLNYGGNAKNVLYKCICKGASCQNI
jgi:hypothetical protein